MAVEFKLIHKDDPDKCYRTDRRRFSLGRSRDCDIVIDDPHISRVQAQVRAEGDRYYIRNMGRNPLLVNDRPARGQRIRPGDVLTLGRTKLVFQAAASPPLPASEQKTQVLPAPPAEEAAVCRLLITSADGKTRSVPFDQDKMVIGRSAEADIRLEDPLVSRRHCLIERRPQGVFARNVSTTNPLLINDRLQTEARLFSGDRLRLGGHGIVFVSSLPADVGTGQRAAGHRSRQGSRTLVVLLALLVFLVALCGGYLVHQALWRPWRSGQQIEAARRQIDAGRLAEARQALMRLLAGELPAEQAERARGLLAKAALEAAQERMAAGDIIGAKKQLNAHLAIYGAGPEAQPLWDRLDHYSIELGKRLEAEGKPRLALQQFAGVREDSLYQAEAKDGIRRIWLALEQRRRKDQTVSQLLAEAETHFSAGRYLTPVNRNAYAVYQAVLVLEPEHRLARERIGQIKEHFRGKAEASFQAGRWAEALGLYERYRIIDPDDRQIQARIARCRRNLAAADKGPQAPETGRTDTDRRQRQVRQLLESSGTESPWIMKYLFEEPPAEAGDETPW